MRSYLIQREVLQQFEWNQKMYELREPHLYLTHLAPVFCEIMDIVSSEIVNVTTNRRKLVKKTVVHFFSLRDEGTFIFAGTPAKLLKSTHYGSLFPGIMR